MRKNYASIYSTLAANVLIAIIKFIAGFFSNSASMIFREKNFQPGRICDHSATGIAGEVVRFIVQLLYR
jgi:hypothetical protein